MTRVLFDARSLDGLPSGTKTRLLHLAPELVRRGAVVGVLHGPALDAGARRALGGAELFLAAAPPRAPWSRAAAARTAWAAACARLRPEVLVHETFPMPAPPAGTRLIGVVHDLRRLRRGALERTVFRALLRGADRVAARWHTPSAAVAAELARELGAGERIDVVPNATAPRDLALLDAASPPPGLPSGRFVFCVGHAEARKDFGLAATLAADARFSGIAFVRAGRGRAAGAALLDAGALDDEARDVLFRRAAVVLAPSRLEGFGLTPLEALAAGGRVLASDLPAHREVLGDAAAFFPAGAPESAVIALATLLRENAAERASAIERGRRRADEFRAARAADAFLSSLSRLP
jgi:glycosyltransferase involved in cell wall biosynthesis